jgi:hypothetical protein
MLPARLVRHAAGAMLGALLLTQPVGATRAAEPVFPGAAAVGLAPPAGMTAAQGFAGFEHPSGASILVAEMPAAAWPQLLAGFTPERLRATGLQVSGEPETLELAGGEARIWRGTQRAHGQSFARWVALARSETLTALVTVQVPESAAADLPPSSVEAALRSIVFRAPRGVAEQMAELPYQVGDLAGFRPVRVVAGHGTLLTDGPLDVDPAGDQPTVIIAPSVGPAPVPEAEQAAFARRALGQFAGLQDLSIVEEQQQQRGAANVVRIRADAVDSRTGRRMHVMQTVLFDGGRYLRVVGVAPEARAEAMTRAERVAASVAFR